MGTLRGCNYHILTILICVVIVSCIPKMDMEKNTTIDSFEIAFKNQLSTRFDFHLKGTFKRAMTEFKAITGIYVFIPSHFDKPHIKSYIPPSDRIVDVNLYSTRSEDILIELTRQVGISYVIVNDKKIVLIRQALSKELPEDTVHEYAKRIVTKRLGEQILDPLLSIDDLLSINDDALVTQEIASHLKDENIEIRSKCLRLLVRYCLVVFSRESIDEKEELKIQAFLYPLIKQIIETEFINHDFYFPPDDLSRLKYACGEYSREILKGLLKNHKYQFYAAIALADQKDYHGIEYIYKGLTSNSRYERRDAVASLWFDCSSKVGLDVLINDIRTAHKSDIQEYIWLLDSIGDKKAIPALIEQIRGPESIGAFLALEKIVGIDMSEKYDSRDVSKEEAYKNWKKWWENQEINQ